MDRSQDSEGFRMPAYVLRKQQRQKRRIIQGNAKESTGSFRGAPEPSRDLFIYRVDKDSTDDDLKTHIEASGINIRLLQCVSHSDAKFKSYRLTVAASQYGELFKDEMWPDGVNIRRYNVPRRSEANTTNW